MKVNEQLTDIIIRSRPRKTRTGAPPPPDVEDADEGGAGGTGMHLSILRRVIRFSRGYPDLPEEEGQGEEVGSDLASRGVRL